MRWLAWGLSDTGLKREHNEDALLIAEEIGLFAVADGMGGHTGGDRASQMAVQILDGAIGTDALGIADARIVAPGEPQRSILWHRVGTLGEGRMPNLASNVVDADGARLLRQWIESLGDD